MKIKTIKTKKGLAQAIGINVRSLFDLMRRPDWPGPKAPPFRPKMLAKILAWRKNTIKPEAGDFVNQAGRKITGADDDPRAAELMGIERQLNIENKRAQLAVKQLQFQKLSGGIVEAATVDAIIVGLIRIFKAGMEELVQVIPAQAVGMDVVTIEAMVRDRVDGISNQLAREGKIKMATPRQVANFRKAK